ncbi:MAG: helix-turn-helix domain-containing protein [Chloroflexota bacterium]|nr:helix-turn-helix domain-containing protein [Chloroflexota bacterium]MDQ5865169.1 helix-turn-helix domain-containing protein [Chloroflexota bacterium]
MPTEPTPGRDTKGAADKDPGGASGGNTDERGTRAESSSIVGTPAEHQEVVSGDAKGKDSAGHRGTNTTAGQRSRQSAGGTDPDDRQQLVALGARLRQLRHARGYKSQLAFVLEAGLPRSYYGDIERGQTNPTIYTLLAIAKALHVELSDLFAPLGQIPPRSDAQEHGTSGASGTAVTTSALEGQHHAGSFALAQPIEPFPFREAQRRLQLKHIRAAIQRSPSSRPQATSWASRANKADRAIRASTRTLGKTAEGAAETESMHSDGTPGDFKERKPKSRGHKGGTLVSTAAAARAFGVNVRTIERWVDAGKLLPWDWVDGRLVVFRRVEIEAIAKEYQKYLALRSQLQSAQSAVKGGADAHAVILASKALKRLLKRYKRKRKRRETGRSQEDEGTNKSGLGAPERE